MSTPAKLGSYPVEHELGRGGMGVVYLARDPRLDRAVAIKILPAALALNPDSLARFEREAKLLAAVNHPNIASIYGVEEVPSTPAAPSTGSGQAGAGQTQRLLVMEYVPGETLGERITRGRMPLADALDVCRQIAGAIEAAHEGGIVHRDLKPGNVKITPDGTVKVLDFGLAKGAAASSADLAKSPTLTYSPTGIGVILGTAGYMSPEQARGRPVDRRTDIWAFGCVLFECLTGRKTFEGETVSDTIARIIEREPEWEALPPATPDRVRDLLRRCLEKDVKKRQRDIGDVRIELEELLAQKPWNSSSGVVARPVTVAPGRRLAVPAVMLLLGAALGIGAWTLSGLSAPRDAQTQTHLAITVPPTIKADTAFFQNDSDTVLIWGRTKNSDGTEDPKRRTYRRSLDSFELTPIPGTDGVTTTARSQDGKWLAVVVPVGDGVERRLVKVPTDGSSPAVTLAEWQNDWRDLHWLLNGDVIIQAAQGTTFFRLPSGGGAAKPPVTFTFEGKYAGGSVVFEAELPGGGLLMTVESWGQRGYQQDIWILDTVTGKARSLIENGGRPQYLPASKHLLFSRGLALMAVSIDPITGATSGEQVALFDGLRSQSWGNGAFGVSKSGHLLFEPGGRFGTNRHIVVVTPTREVTPFVADGRAYEAALTASPDGRQVAVVIPTSRGTYEIWTATSGQPGIRRSLSFPNADANLAYWSKDQQWLAFNRWGRDKDDGIYVQRADGGGTPKSIIKASSAEEIIWITDWSSDITGVVANRGKGGSNDIIAIPISATGEPGAVRALRATPANEADAHLSRDGRLMAFESDESGRFEMYVTQMAGGNVSGQPLLVSNGPSNHARWALDDRRLYFMDSQQRVVVTTIETAPVLKASAPVVVYDLRALRIDPGCWDILPDGRLVGVQRETGEDDVTWYNVILNWIDQIGPRLPKR